MSDDKRKPNERAKTRFEPVDRKPPAAAPPPPTRPPEPPAQLQPAPEPARPVPAPALRALELGHAPGYAGLRRDERGVVVGTQGVVAIQSARRLAAFLAALSQASDLAHGVAVEAHAGARFLVVLTPAEMGESPAQCYARVQSALAAAHLSASRARLFVGDERAMVPYADPAAPHGYDLIGQPPAGSRTLLWPGHPPLSLPLHPDVLRETLLGVPLQPAAASPPTTLSLLTDRRLAALVAGYVQRHGLAYGVRFLTWQQGAQVHEAALFDVVAADALRPVPAFVGDFLARLPHTVLLADAQEPADLEHEPERRVLVARGRRTSLYLPHIQDLLPPRCLLILAAAPWGAALIDAPTPRITLQRLAEATVSAPATTSLSTQPTGRLNLRLELRRDGPSHGPVHGLLLDGRALARLQRMVRRLPAHLFAHARIALGDEVALILADDDRELHGIPLGQPLARSEPPTLLLPRGMRLLPALPQDLLVPSLGMRPDTLTVLTPTGRYDVPVDALQPLSRLLRLDPPAVMGRIDVRPTALPPLDLSDLEELPARPATERPTTEALPPVSEKEQRSILDRLFRSKPEEGPKSGDFSEQLRRRAADLEQRGELELAAAFYTYLHDDQRAAACYQRITQGAKA